MVTDRESLASRAVSAGLYKLGGHGASLAMRLGGNLVMTRLLAPEAFGLMAIVTALQVAMVMFSDFGMRTAIVRSRNGEHPDFLRTVFTLQVGQFAIIAFLILAVAGGLAVAQGYADFGETVYGDPRLPILLALSSLAMVAQGLRSTNIAVADRKLLQARVTVMELVSQFAGVASTIGVGFVYPTVYALIVGMIVSSSVSAIMTHAIFPGPRMGFALRRDFVAEIWGFGRWLVGASIMGFFANQGDRLVLSALMTKEQLGLYAIAMLWVGAARIAIRKVMSPTMAALSELWRD
ncbi:MAG: oligosaccharide flippase family protein, partial [Pseudomonadota bacterium]